MIIDLLLVLVFLVSFALGWSLRILIPWLRLLWIICFAALIYIILPYFLIFVHHSSAEILPGGYFGYGLVVAVLIFLSFYTLVKGRRKSSGLRRFSGSLVMAVLSFYSLLIILATLNSYGWISTAESIVFTNIPQWILHPVD